MKPSILRYNALAWLLILLLGVGQLQAQENDTQDESDENTVRFISYQLSLKRNLAFGDNFAGEALSQKVGYNAALRFYVYRSFFLGIEGGSFTAEVDNKTLVGDFDYSNANTYGLTAGYSFVFNAQHALDISLAYGFANYRNKKNDLDDRFVDNGTYFKGQLQYNYKFSTHFSLYVFTALRYDSLTIDASSQISDFLNKAQYFSFGFGVKVNMTADKSKLW